MRIVRVSILALDTLSLGTLRDMVIRLISDVEYATRIEASLAGGIRRDRGGEETHILHSPALKLICCKVPNTFENASSSLKRMKQIGLFCCGDTGPSQPSVTQSNPERL